ncbi:hypothetical protein PGT21_015178 [Puccinia graminis f. sp. tritici]|uniref:Uncharacterized protein n=1 Tax=Puccinia graminis f. sp. tritici TaxID=56615 RepID=A0A5B0QXG5_PUCGR|nr:hypothetical protein PGTUg99_017450 [Puccinia graminis f. sp. tritici]KAA1099540.1 hypothetical protein PGT21_011123 [Puccinia graminis f. sp. tritici]KAA1117575.1 hypothetical protein PGT21_015178 [Puccinia graminis f. sp. tritici]
MAATSDDVVQSLRRVKGSIELKGGHRPQRTARIFDFVSGAKNGPMALRVVKARLQHFSRWKWRAAGVARMGGAGEDSVPKKKGMVKRLDYISPALEGGRRAARTLPSLRWAQCNTDKGG